ncbi:FkbM family methyltransferase [Sneathiella marina]|uniref:FkbM family methyltransferase n=1 Tax=Sneathiella marina TaxID=2950108 RepID=A0ABY4W6Q2_9PROT|nr:FkbM family methyltransferase [Sneathiella marina]USG62850.1 FkbM family methyltransferase [Sneathiella marina]
MANKLEKFFVREFRDKPLKKFFSSVKGLKVICKSLPERLSAVTIREEDHLIICDPRDLVGRSVVLHGNWGRTETEKVVAFLEDKEMLSGNGVAMDLGANIGTQTLYLYLTGKFKKVIAVEAAPKNFDFLHANVRVNGWTESIEPHHAAIYTEDGVINLNLKEEDVSGGHSLLELPGNSNSVEVPAITIKSLINTYSIEPEQVEFVWMDIEGFDFEILQEIQKTIGSKLPVFFEFSPHFMGEQKTREFVEFVQSHYTHIYEFQNLAEDPVRLNEIDAFANTDQKDLLVYSR